MEASTSSQPRQPATPSHSALLPSLSPSVKNEPTPAPPHTLPPHLQAAGGGSHAHASPPVTSQTPTRMLPPPNPNGTPTPAQRGQGQGQKVFSAVMGSAPGQVPPSPASSNARVYASVYSGIPVYEAMIRGISVMRRTSDSWVNATQILKVAGVPKSARTKILDKEVILGEHEKVQGGYGKYQGTWIPYQRGQELAQQYGVTAYLAPIFDFQPSPNSLSALPVARAETPNKSGPSASAGYNAGFMAPQQPSAGHEHPRMESPFSAAPGPGPMSGLPPPPPPPQWNGGGMMFHQHPHPSMGGYPGQPPPSLYYPSPHPDPMPHPYPGHMRMMSSNSTDSNGNNLAPAAELNGVGLPPSNAQMYQDEFGHVYPIRPTRSASMAEEDFDMEPPAKRLRAEDGQVNGSEEEEDDDELRDAPPLPSAMRLSTKPTHPKQSSATHSARSKLLDLFSPKDQTNDVRAHLGFKTGADEEQPFDIDTIIDEHGHTALHWAASLAKISIVSQLIELGADIHRGNFNGETALARAVLTTNNAEAASLSDLLKHLSPSIGTLDHSYRSVIHHVALVSGIAGCSAAARTYMTGVLEWVAKEQQMSASLSQNQSQASSAGGANGAPAANLSLKTLVDMQDSYGDTALNVSARTGSRGLVKLLLDAGADKAKGNKLGLRPVDFGVEVEALAISPAEAVVASIKSETNRPERHSRDVQKNIAATFENINETFSNEITAKQTVLNQTEQNVRHATRSLADKRQQIHRSQLALNELEQIARKAENARKALTTAASQDWTGRSNASSPHGPAFNPIPSHVEQPQSLPVTGTDIPMSESGEQDAVIKLRRLRDWEQRTAKILDERIQALEGEGLEKELKYRRLVSLCTKVPVEKVDGMLEHLTSAIQSDGPSIDLSRITTFINKMKGDVGVGR